MASVELRGLTKRYGELAVVDDISLTIDHGRLVCLLGPSGCGKTTTLRLIAGFGEAVDRRYSGGRPARLLAGAYGAAGAAQHVDDLPELRAFAHMTVAQNVAFGLEMRRVPASVNELPRS